jgi:hypothetical protein
VTDEALGRTTPLLDPDHFAIEDVPDEEWDAFHAAIAEA